MMLNTHIQGIPCQVEVSLLDVDWYGKECFEIKEVYDRKGYKAKWLSNKITKTDIERIGDEIYA